MSDYIGFALLFFFMLLRYIIVIDVILSWFPLLFAIKVQIPFVHAVLDPIYRPIRSLLPAWIAGMDFTPIIVILGIMLIERGILLFFPGVSLLW